MVLKLIDTPPPTPKDNCVIAETEYTAVSAGTGARLTSFAENLIQKAMERPDQVKITEKMTTDGIITTLETAFTRLAEPMPGPFRRR